MRVRRSRLLGGSIVAILGLLAGERLARAADETPSHTIGAQPIWYLMGGVTGGGTLVANDRGGYLGGELSVVRMRDARFFGLYGDGYYDFGAKRTYTTGGIELGYKMFGLDGGAAARIGGDRVEWGPTGRLFLSVGVLSIYGRYAYFPDPLRSGDDHVVQVGALLKLPFAVWGRK